MQQHPSDTEGRPLSEIRDDILTPRRLRLQRDLPLPGFQRFAVLTPRLLIDAAPL